MYWLILIWYVELIIGVIIRKHAISLMVWLKIKFLNYATQCEELYIG